jgi:lipase
VTADLHVHRYGPSGPIQMLAIHGLTGHGQRWAHLAGFVPEISFAAPDLLGHGRSSWAAPWSIDANVSALAGLLDELAADPVLVVGHSFGGGVAIHLAAAHPDRVAALLLLDPALGLNGAWMSEIAHAMFSYPDYTDRAEARAEKAYASWSDVDPAVLDADLDEHLIELTNGRYGWRISLPAMMSYWSELARDAVLPPAGTPTTLVRAKGTSPPYVGDELLAGLRQRLGTDFELLDFECNHMVAGAKPTEVAALIRKLLGTR